MTIASVKNKRTQLLFLSSLLTVAPVLVYTNVDIEITTEGLAVAIADGLEIELLADPPEVYTNVEVELVADVLTVEVTDTLTIELLCGYSS